MRDTVTIGSTIQLTHPREGWKTWTRATRRAPTTPPRRQHEGRRDRDRREPREQEPFPVTLKVFRQIPGYYPTADLN
jgi:hypothetical protein